MIKKPLHLKKPRLLFPIYFQGVQLLNIILSFPIKTYIRKILLTRFFFKLLKWGRFQYRALLTYS